MKIMIREYSIKAKKVLDQVIDFFFVAVMGGERATLLLFYNFCLYKHTSADFF